MDSVNVFSMLLRLKDSGETMGTGNAVNNIARFITMLIIFILILLLTYYTTRFVAGAKKGSLSATNMELLESLQLGQGKYLQLMRLGSRYVVLAVSKDRVELVTELPADEYIPAPSSSGGDFKDILLKSMKDGIGAVSGKHSKEGSDE